MLSPYIEYGWIPLAFLPPGRDDKERTLRVFLLFFLSDQAVIFLASYDEAGSAGFILNRPTSVQLGDLVEGNALRQFQKTPLYLGGDVGQ